MSSQQSTRQAKYMRRQYMAGNASYERKSPVVNLGYWSEVSVETSLWGNYAKYNLD